MMSPFYKFRIIKKYSLQPVLYQKRYVYVMKNCVFFVIFLHFYAHIVDIDDLILFIFVYFINILDYK